MSTSRKYLSAALATLLFVGTAASFAYTLVFRDGSTLVVEGKYRIDGDRLLATLLSGTETFFNLSEVDIAETERRNKQNFGSALVLDGDVLRPLEQSEQRGARGLEQLVFERGANRGIFSKPKATARLRKTPTGNLDLFTLPSTPLADDEATGLVMRIFRKHGVAASVRQGSEEGRILLEINTNTRGTVFAALTGSAVAMLELVDEMPEVQFLELAMSTNSRSRAGMFVMGYEDAVALADGKIEPEHYFHQNVLF